MDYFNEMSSAGKLACLVGAFVILGTVVASMTDAKPTQAQLQHKAIQDAIYSICGSYRGRFYTNGGVVCDGG